MGKEINKSRFSKRDFSDFKRLLNKETQLLKDKFDQQEFIDQGLVVGLEIEGWLVDQNYKPASLSDELIENIGDQLIVHELMKFNFELNVTPVQLQGDCFKQLENELNQLWKKCTLEAEKLNCYTLFIGMLPTAKVEDFKLKRMSNLQRYHALNNEILKKRQNRQIDLSISGIDQHIDRFYDILLEASTTSTQIHLQLPPKKSLDYFNASIYLSAATVALSSNSPFFFDCHLWEETRIPVFEQIVYIENEQDPKGRKRTGFGSYLKNSIMECFVKNERSFSPLLPAKISDQLENLEHLKLHNGTIWRWNRPLIGEVDGNWHLRLEHRPISSGPTIVDMMANIAFFLGVCHALVEKKIDFKKQVNSEKARANFYSAARYGLDAKIREGKSVRKLKKIFIKQYIPLMEEGLKLLKIDQGSINKYVEIVKNRVKSGQTGANWQAKYIKKYGKKFDQMIKVYIKNQKTGAPVHTWKVD